MPFIPHTPESLLPRSDSKNPAATCHGLTSAGRPCRRAIARLSIFSRYQGRVHDPDVYCWQHKDQAAAPAGAVPQGLKISTINERTSVDTLVDRLGLVDIQGGAEDRRQPNDVVIADLVQASQAKKAARDQDNRRKVKLSQKAASRSKLSLFCWFGPADEELNAPRLIRAREKHKTSTSKKRQSNGQSIQQITSSHTRPPTVSAQPLPPSRQRVTAQDRHHSLPMRPFLSHSPSSRTAEFLSLIPPTATPQTTALLLAELDKTLSVHDEEGYIYIFWLTPTSLPSIPPPGAASSLLSPPASRPLQNRRRTSEVLQTFSTAGSTVDDGVEGDDRTKGKIVLKIGRASNVQRRLNEWSRQCGHNLSLIRYYPYAPSSLPKPSQHGIATPTKVPHVHRVERLIHIELADMRAREGGRCTSCGTQHREWFEVEASRDGVRSVDEVVRRWVCWGIGRGNT